MLIVGAIVAGAGALVYLLGRGGVGKLPGDLSFGGRGWRVYVLLGTSIILSVVITVILWVITRVRR